MQPSRTHVAVFVEAGLDTDCLAQLCAAADAMRAQVDSRTQARARRGGATRGIDEMLRNARMTVRVLNAFVRKEIKTDAALLTAWDSVQREMVRRRRNLESDPAAPNVALHLTPQTPMDQIAA
jgi:hypothetical protein